MSMELICVLRSYVRTRALWTRLYSNPLLMRPTVDSSEKAVDSEYVAAVNDWIALPSFPEVSLKELCDYFIRLARFRQVFVQEKTMPQPIPQVEIGFDTGPS